jgi:Holliday junction resolvase RusA-like endonuclease
VTRWTATLEGIRVISLKNSKRVVRAGGRTVVLPSKAHQKFLDRALPLLAPLRPAEPFTFPYTLRATFYLKGRLDADTDNLTCTINDLLMEAGIVADDKACVRIVAEKCPGAPDFLTAIEIVEQVA